VGPCTGNCHSEQQLHQKAGSCDAGANLSCFYVDNYWPATDRLKEPFGRGTVVRRQPLWWSSGFPRYRLDHSLAAGPLEEHAVLRRAFSRNTVGSFYRDPVGVAGRCRHAYDVQATRVAGRHTGGSSTQWPVRKSRWSPTYSRNSPPSNEPKASIGSYPELQPPRVFLDRQSALDPRLSDLFCRGYSIRRASALVFGSVVG
jgi:hypothetical protein